MSIKVVGKKGICFKCGENRILAPGHKVCGNCHNPVKCHTCNPQKGKKVAVTRGVS